MEVEFPLLIEGHAHAVQGILFDKDGTLLDFLSTWGLWTTTISQCLVKQFPAVVSRFSSMERAWGIGATFNQQGAMMAYDPDGPLATASANDIMAVFAQHLYQVGIPWNLAVTSVETARQEANDRLETTSHLQPVHGLVPFLQLCVSSDVPLAVVTSDDTENARHHLEGMGISKFFRAIIGRDLVKRGKPHPEMAYLACEQLGVDPTKVAVIGDTRGDMQMARAMGAALAICIRSAHRGYSKSQYTEADATICNYAELLP